MCNDNSRSVVGEAPTVAALSVRNGVFVSRKDQEASEACAKFLKAAALLPEDGWLGFQLNAGKDDGAKAFALAGAKGKTTLGDLDWVFKQVGEVSRTEGEPALDLFADERRVYALITRKSAEAGEKREAVFAIEDCDEYDGCAPGSIRWFGDVYDELVSIGAMLRLTMEAGEEGQGSILISLPEEMSLKLRAMLALALPDITEVELTTPSDPRSGMTALSGKTFASAMIGFLASMLNRASTSEFRLPFDDDDDEVKTETENDDDEANRERDSETGFTPIEELELSVRAYSALKRAGIKSVEELSSKSDKELMSIRNLGRKALAEIREKLREISIPKGVNASRSEALDKLIGLHEVKEQVRRITAFARMRKHMADQGRPAAPVVLNMGFVGNPGTAKTTVARILAGMLHDVGLLASDELIEVGRADLVGQYEGHTADKVKEVFKRAKGKLLFIDEAYSLLENIRGGFGDEAIDTIVQEMENNRGDTVVIFAGYPDKMMDFISRNPGLRSRVPFTIGFRDYSADEMAEIAALEAKKRGFSIADDAKETVRSMCEKAKRNSENGNGRFCRNLVEDAVLSYASRVFGASVPEKADYVLLSEDFALPKAILDEKKGKPIGFAA